MENYPLRLNNLSYVKIKQGPFKILYFPFPKSSQISSIENYILEDNDRDGWIAFFKNFLWKFSSIANLAINYFHKNDYDDSM